MILFGVLGVVGAVAFTLRFSGTTLSDLADTNRPKDEKPAHNPKLERIVGKASVLDRDTIEIGGKLIRLFGIDAPEKWSNLHYQTKTISV